MGGRIFIGVRTASGVEHVGETWTNWLPMFFAQRELYEGEGGKPVQELIEWWDHRDSNDFGDRTTRIRNSEYGVVLLDIPSNEIWEQNAYFTPLAWNYGSADNREAASLFLEIMETKAYSSLELYRVGREDLPRVGPPTPEELRVIQDTAKRFVQGGHSARGNEVMGLLTVHLPWARRVHDRTGGQFLRAQKDWDSMVAWLTAKGWKTPVNRTPR